MKMTQRTMALTLLIISSLLAGCWKEESTPPVPAMPQYNTPSQWYITDRQGEADLFYIISTETGDYVSKGVTYHHADTYNDSVRGPLYNEMLGVDTLLSGKLNFFAPYYRQCSLQSFANSDLEEERLAIAVDDVRRAFKHYLTMQNNGRPFILAGFSQGAIILLELLKEMDAETYARMIAAYAIGMSIPQQVVDDYQYVVPARSAEDTGVTICYNSARDAEAALWGKSAVAINPLNWHTDSTSAVLVTETSPLLPVSEQPKDTLTVHLDQASGLLFVQGYKGTDYRLPLFGKEGNYHTREIWFYRDALCENMALRTTMFIEQHAMKK